jgi:pyruvate/2-oxoglutarate/acetoin dehydrogenase E1 component
VSVLGHLAEVVAQLLRDDDQRVLLGEDVADGGMLGLSREAVKDRELRARVLPTPLTPTVLLAHAAGLAGAGAHPLVLLPSVGAALEGLAGLREAASWSWRNEHAVRVPLCVVAPCGPGFGLGGDASEAAAAVLTAVPGLTVLCAGQADEAGAWLRAAAEHAVAEGPTLLLLPRRVLLGSVTDAHVESLGRSPTTAVRVHKGEAATVFAWGAALPVALEAVQMSGVDAAVIDVACLAPLPLSALEAEARATGKLVIVHAGPRTGGVGAELAAHFADAAILHLDAPIVRVTGAAPPRCPADEAAAVPTVAQVVEAIERVASY